MKENLREIHKFIKKRVIKLCSPQLDPDKDNYVAYPWNNLVHILNAVALHTNINPFESSLDSLEIKNIFINWKFLNEDGTECTFEQQSEETQSAIAKLLGYGGEND